MSERREFVEVERLGNMARYSVTVPIEADPAHARIDALERRVEKLERLLNHKTGKHDSNQEEPGGADKPADD